MLTSITLQNFKGIREKMTIPLRPITLLFGANSIGKSTIVQAIHYAREILQRGNLNADRTLAGGRSVDLGGFLNLLHNRDKQNKMLLRFDFDTGKTDFPDYGFNEKISSVVNLSNRAQTASVELELRWSQIIQRPVLVRYETGINGVPIAKAETSLDGANITAYKNCVHPLEFDQGERIPVIASPRPDWRPSSVTGLRNSLPTWGKALELEPDEEMDEESVFPPLVLLHTQSLVSPGEILLNELRHFRYLGPLRKTPLRNYSPSLTAEEEDWADGTGAWDALCHSSQALIEEVSTWMADRLKTGYSVLLKQFREIPADSPLLNELFVALRNESFYDNFDLEYFEQERDRPEVRQRLVLVEEEKNLELMPQDVGVGISQLLPVVVAALDTREGILAVEQPELHLHPAVQAELGDLFIESALGERQNLTIIETHSEHLILRILRRIRETSADRNNSTQPVTPEDVALLFIGNRQTGTTVQHLRIDKKGNIIDPVPGGFFEEDFAELF